jgi:hypothetical protein
VVADTAWNTVRVTVTRTSRDRRGVVCSLIIDHAFSFSLAERRSEFWGPTRRPCLKKEEDAPHGTNHGPLQEIVATDAFSSLAVVQHDTQGLVGTTVRPT